MIFNGVNLTVLLIVLMLFSKFANGAMQSNDCPTKKVTTAYLDYQQAKTKEVKLGEMFEDFMNKIHTQVVKPTVEGLVKDNLPYKGFIFIGLIKVGDQPKVIEYNVRLGDPETEVVLPRIENDLVDVFTAVANQTLDTIDIKIDERTATTVMTVSGGYPEAYEKGKEITGLESVDGSIVFHAGTTLENGKIVTSGGRVMAVTSFGANFKDALAQSYKNVEKLHFDKMNYRKDLGFDL